MKVEEIERLLVEFYEGKTSEQDEERLKKAFRTQEVPAHLQRDKRLFLSFSCREENMDKAPAGLTDKLNRMIEEEAMKEQMLFRRNKTQRSWRWGTGIAATIVLLLGISYGILNMEDMHTAVPQDTFTNPEDAYDALQATLIEVSTNLNKGIKQVEATKLDLMLVNQEIKTEIQR